jgi:sec-independent protein translocase protein TatA
MGGLSLVHWVIVLVAILLLFGAGRLPNVMGDFAKGIKAFRAGMRDEDGKPSETPPSSISQGAPQQPVPGANQTASGDRKVG